MNSRRHNNGSLSTRRWRLYGYFILSAVMLVCTACASRPTVGTYGYAFCECTGITQHVVHQGKEIAIDFAEDSEPQALASLRALKWNVLYPNADGKKMFLTGILHDEIKHTPSGPGRAPSEPYREFTLMQWSISTPFTRVGWPGDPMEEETGAHLRSDDFDDFAGKASLEMQALESP